MVVTEDKFEMQSAQGRHWTLEDFTAACCLMQLWFTKPFSLRLRFDENQT